jgi:hypothetical protein
MFARKLGFVSGHDLVVPKVVANTSGFTGCVKTYFVSGQDFTAAQMLCFVSGHDFSRADNHLII